MTKWWQLSAEQVLIDLKTGRERGLDTNEAAERMTKYGPNQLKEGKKISAFEIFIGQFKDFIVWVLIGAGVISGFMGEWIDAAAIVLIVILNAVMGFIQEYRAEKSLAALKKLSSPNSKVIRDGVLVSVPSSALVPGDLIELEAGDNVPADSRIIYHTSNFMTSEASLTGESNPVAKTSAGLTDDAPLADRANMVYMGTNVAQGKARAIVCETGMNTELGKIAGIIEDIGHEATPLQKKLEEFGKWIVYVCFVLVALVFAMGILRGGKAFDMFLTAVSLAVAAIPEGLPAVVTIALALGVQRMVKRHVLIRKLPAVDTLGCATVICSDKTGTLTRNEMTVKAVYAEGFFYDVTGTGYEPKGVVLLGQETVSPGSHPGLDKAVECGILCNGAALISSQGQYRITGDPTEGALLVLGAKYGMDKQALEKERVFVEELPFDSVRKRMTIIRKSGSVYTAYVKGAPEITLSGCSRIFEKGSARRITPQDIDAINGANNALADKAMRVLALSYREFDKMPDDRQAENIENDMVFIGLAAMIDPPREEVKKAMLECKNADIHTVMITGDHKNTAVSIAKELGFFDTHSIAYTGEELDKISDEELSKNIERIPVYARVSPEHKLRIVKAWRSRGEIVAMTGDGVNDAPAVKEADIGVAMGITGTDVTKEVSDMVITDDNFASIVAAVEEGRGIYDNIKKFIHYLLSCNCGEILVMFTASLVGIPVPLLPIHILWVNLVTDGFPALALGVDPVEKNIMSRPPRPKNENVIGRHNMAVMIMQGAFIAFCTLLAFCVVMYIEKEGLARARTAAFVVLSCSQLFHSFNCRSMTCSIFSLGVFTNMNLIYASLVSFALTMGAVYIPLAQKVFKTEPLSLVDWCMVITISSLPLWLMELVKLANRKRAPCAPQK